MLFSYLLISAREIRSARERLRESNVTGHFNGLLHLSLHGFIYWLDQLIVNTLMLRDISGSWNAAVTQFI
jgi:hypothetical protein